ncbi:MAG: hypothetical protein WD066_19335 [Planctomycetaceae bacterium]
MKTSIASLALSLAWLPAAIFAGNDSLAAASRADVLLVLGAEGTPEYGAQFRTWAARWQAAASRGGARITLIGSDDRNAATSDATGSDRELLRNHITELARDAETGNRPLWIVLIGHGTFDRREAKFNLRGPDVSAVELADWIEAVARPLAIVECASASGPFVEALSRPGRVVVTATKSGSEADFARFGDQFSRALLDPEADLDQDEQTSLLEAFLFAARRTAEFYEQEGRLATEHALLDDNGDGRGARADDFRGVRPRAAALDGDALPDGLVAHQWHLVPNRADAELSEEARRRRDELERKLFHLRERKPELEEGQYLRRLESIAVELAMLYSQPPGQ